MCTYVCVCVCVCVCVQLPCLSSLHTWVCALLCCAVPCCAVLCCAVLCSTALCCIVLCCAVLCCALLCCAPLCSTALCCVVLALYYIVLHSVLIVLCCIWCIAVQCGTVLYCTGLSYHWFQSFVQPTSNSFISPVQLQPSLGHLILSDKILRFIKMSGNTWNTKKKPTVSVAQLYSVLQHDSALLALKSSTTP